MDGRTSAPLVMYETFFWRTVETTNLNYQLVPRISSSNSIQAVVSNILCFHSKNFGKKSSILTIIFFKGGWAKNHQPGQPGYHLIPEPLQKSTLGTPGFPRGILLTARRNRSSSASWEASTTRTARWVKEDLRSRGLGELGRFFGGVGDFVLSGEQKKWKDLWRLVLVLAFCFFLFRGGGIRGETMYMVIEL